MRILGYTALSTVVFFLSSHVYAACVNPAGVAGDTLYNQTEAVMQYCDNTNWISFPRCDSSSGPPTSGLVGHWEFNDGSGTTAVDSSGLGNTGTLTNMDGGTDWVTGHDGTGYALDFDGVDDYVDAGSASVLDNLGPVSVCAWVKQNAATSTFPGLVDKSSNGWDAGFQFYMVGNSYAAFYTRYSDYYEYGIPYNVTTWEHFCGTWDGTQYSGGNTTAGMIVYTNGVPHSGAATQGWATNDDSAFPLRIGMQMDGPSAFHGILDDVRVYNRVLSQAEISLIYDGGPAACPAAACASPAGAVGDIFYNTTHHVLQYCAATGWISAGPTGNGGAGCASPSGVEGDIIYNSTHNVLQYCEGDAWVGIGK